MCTIHSHAVECVSANHKSDEIISIYLDVTDMKMLLMPKKNETNVKKRTRINNKNDQRCRLARRDRGLGDISGSEVTIEVLYECKYFKH